MTGLIGVAVTSNGATRNEVAKTFMELVRIPSPSGRELKVMKYIEGYLSRLGIASRMDGAGRMVGSDAGNLIARLGSGSPRLLFMAHVDTVEDGKRAVRPSLNGGVVRSDGTTILGSDDKAGVAALLEAIKELNGLDDLPEVTCVFTVREEGGRMGATCIRKNNGTDFAFDVDGSDKPGRFVNRALGNMSFEVRVHGRESHAAVAPEKGANAIRAASLLVSRLRLGRDASGRTINIGRISGGRKLNVVPGYALLEGEVRAFDPSGIGRKLAEVKDAARRACTETSCTFELAVTKENNEPPLLIPPGSRITALARAACERAGMSFSLITLYGTMQGNVLAQKGYQVLGLCKGGSLQHSNRESVTVKELNDTRKLIVEIVKTASRLAHGKG